MNRRNFLKGLGALTSAFALPGFTVVKNYPPLTEILPGMFLCNGAVLDHKRYEALAALLGISWSHDEKIRLPNLNSCPTIHTGINHSTNFVTKDGVVHSPVPVGLVWEIYR